MTASSSLPFQTTAISSPPPSVAAQMQANSAVKATVSTPVAALPSPSSTVPAPARPEPATSECKFCDEEFPAAEIDDHEDKCV